MKIICNKDEFEALIRNCQHSYEACCAGCPLSFSNCCDGIEDFCTIEPETEGED